MSGNRTGIDGSFGMRGAAGGWAALAASCGRRAAAGAEAPRHAGDGRAGDAGVRPAPAQLLPADAWRSPASCCRVYNVWAKYRLPVTGRPDLAQVLEQRKSCKPMGGGGAEAAPAAAGKQQQ